MVFPTLLPLAAATGLFATLRLRTYLHPFQQEEYDNPRLLRWWAEKKAWDRYATAGLLALTLPALLRLPNSEFLIPWITALWLTFRAWREPNPLRTAKKPLVATARATQILFLAAFLALPVPLALLILVPALWFPPVLILHIQSLPLYLILANALLRPLQSYQNRRYTTEAHTLLARLNPTIVGLTGSFGKTSTKYILNHILAAHAPTLATPGSVNTPLGIARVVREQLTPAHQYFLAEMGAYGEGSIAGLCKLAPPRLSCITAVGEAHYERFKSLETVAKAKFEIAEATHRNGGTCVINADAIPDALWQPRVQANPMGYILVSARPQVLRAGDTLLQTVEETPQGLKLTLTIVSNTEHRTRNTEHSLTIQTPLFGRVQAGNIAVAATLALQLGLKPAAIAAALKTVPAAPHRLNIQRNGQQILIDDAYNANPQGFRTALETLTLLADDKKRRRILVTPGLVELGTKHAAVHAELGAYAARHADLALVIQPDRIPTFVQALGETETHTFATLAEARTWLQAHGRADDVILLANDLPDRYEAIWRL